MLQKDHEGANQRGPERMRDRQTELRKDRQTEREIVWEKQTDIQTDGKENDTDRKTKERENI